MKFGHLFMVKSDTKNFVKILNKSGITDITKCSIHIELGIEYVRCTLKLSVRSF